MSDTDAKSGIPGAVARAHDRRGTAEDRRLGRLRIHVVCPATASSAGVLLYPTITGLNDTMRRFAGDLAQEGMTAVVWDPYDGEDGTDVIPEMLARSLRCEDRQVVSDLTEIADHMESELGLDSIGAIGWCFGARIAILHAGSDERVSPVSAYNPTIWSPTPVDVDGRQISRADFPGQTMDELALAARIRGAVQVSRPEHDLAQPAEYERLMDALYSRKDPTFYEYYPHAQHGFSYTPGEVNARAHRFAWSNTLALFSASASTEEVTA